MLRSLDLDGYSLMLGLEERHNPFYEQLAECFRFCFVRHPGSWYESYFKYQTTVGWLKSNQLNPDGWHRWRGLDQCASDDFCTFVRNCIRWQPAYLTRMYEWYAGPWAS